MSDRENPKFVTGVGPSTAFEVTRRWLDTPLGQDLLQQEARIVEEAFEGLFGEECLQLGLWGEPRHFLRYARTRRSAVLASPPHVWPGEAPDAYGRPYRLPVASDSIDVVLEAGVALVQEEAGPKQAAALFGITT